MRFLAAAVVLLIVSGSVRAESCIASTYGHKDGYNNSKTANGERINTYRDMTAAHRTLPFGTMVTVTNKRNGKSVIVRINDRGPFRAGRCIDLSYAAAQAIGMGNSVVPVTVRR